MNTWDIRKLFNYIRNRVNINGEYSIELYRLKYVNLTKPTFKINNEEWVISIIRDVTRIEQCILIIRRRVISRLREENTAHRSKITIVVSK